MRIFSPLRHRPVALLWSGQLLSALGDEVNKVAVAWLATSLLGVRAGYLSALYAAAAFVACLFGGHWADRWARRDAMVRADVVRAVAVVTLPVAASLGAPMIWVLAPVVVVSACLSTVFEPALRASLPQVTPSLALLSPTNALMESTTRFARIGGPSLVAALSAFVPMVHFFTLDAVTFLGSAVSIGLVARVVPSLREPPPKAVDASVIGGISLMNRTPLVRYMLLSSIVAGGTWIMVLPTGIALLVQLRFPGDVRSLGVVLAAYGVGNLTSNLVAGSLSFSRSDRLLFLGRVVCGAGFVAMSMAPSVMTMGLCAAIAATGGPITDIGFFNVLQKTFGDHDLARIYRLAGAFVWGGTLAVFLATPMLCELFGVPAVVGMAGGLLALTGVLGLMPFGADQLVEPAAAASR